ncbi:MAG: SpoIID/LytB domain-containing protein [Candidatus Omnitrophica bacterium]|nr:SpoIID/LytB domain-containing protein [Candidatus Omnitrophota bacterium]
MGADLQGPARALLLFGGVLAACGLEAAEPAWIRVAVAQQPQVELAIHGRYRMVAIPSSGSGDALHEGARLPTVSVRASQDGILVGERLLPSSGVLVEPAREATIALNGQRLRGVVEIRKQQDLTLLVINHVDLEDYLRGVVSKEAPDYWPMEALRAIAIAARTYTLFQRLSKASLDYDVTSDVLSQVYGGKSAERGRTNRAVRDTRGLVLTYQGRLFPAFYHSTCGGATEHGSVMGPFDLEPLRGNLACTFCAASPFYRWQRRLTTADIAWAVKQQGRGSVWPVQALDVAAYSPTGRVAQVRIRGAGRERLVSGYEFRRLFGFASLRSTAFAIIPDGNGFILQGRGWGHGVGLCQWGAAELARLGLKAPEILAYYYPNSVLVRLQEVNLQPVTTGGM